MALVQTSLIWVAYAVAIAILLVIAALFVYMYQAPRDRAASVTIVCIFTMSALLATVLLMPVDVALVSSTNIASQGRRKNWATPNHVDGIVKTLTIVYYTLYSLDAILCLLVVPFTYFYYEEYDDDAAEVGEQTVGSRLWGAFKYTLGFLVFTVAVFVVGFFVPFAKQAKGDKRLDLDYFRHLLEENHGERALTFVMGLLMLIGTVLYALYTGAGMALLPVALIKSAPSISAPALAANTSSQLEQNRERQRQLEGRNEGREGGLDARDRRELESLVREERTLIRRERFAAESSGEDRHWIVKAWIKTEAIFRPLKLIGGLILLVFALLVFTSMLITGIDKAKNSICGSHCGYILGYMHIFQPINYILVKSSKVFPIDYVLFLLLVLFFFSASVVGIATVGIRFLWVTLFKIRKGHTSPQALLMSTVLLTLMVLAINYSIAMLVAPQYATFGSQTFCDREPRHPGEQPDCSNHHSAIKPCRETTKRSAASEVCTPSVISTFVNRITINFPVFGIVLFWAQFAFLGVYMIVFLLTLFKTPKMDTEQMDADLEEEEEEGLLASTGRRFGATWQDITGRGKRSYGTSEGRTNGEHS
ncbi:LMBR1-like membrane protein-domain-containing protein [Clohesyomyces aquaticus]|uniref:Probable lysosomal cobalamin transporter n=1 Tax=Clohesyomyces aquaticus TaxID=1231657 RepID=A0A1Y1YVB1_9PLEO|nr:LMBR1-like membrane protein-domain-containing protein [Clohesyomyces aquaticus]